MSQTIKIVVFTLALVFIANGQIPSSMKDVLLPSANDSAEAEKQGVEVFKILPRGMFDYENNELSVRGGGAYYSFVNKSHSYNKIPQISLEQNSLKTGFYGASYGFMADLGEISLSEIDEKTKGVDFLMNYQPPGELSKARIEQRKARGFEAENLVYKSHLPAVVGHSYIVRAISYDEADVLVAFRIYRKDADGSLIIFWKLIENFEKPFLARNQ